MFGTRMDVEHFGKPVIMNKQTRWTMDRMF